MNANALATIPDFSPRPVSSAALSSPVRAILADLEARGLRDPLELSEALADAAARLARIARNPDIRISSRFAMIEAGPGRHILQHDGHRIADVHAPDPYNDRWSVYVTLRIDQALPAPLRWYITHFDSLDAVKSFLSIDQDA